MFEEKLVQFDNFQHHYHHLSPDWSSGDLMTLLPKIVNFVLSLSLGLRGQFTLKMEG